MSWEAFRWTAKSPSELYHVLGPHGVDDLVRQTIAAVWRDLPAEGRTLAAGVGAVREVFDRNINVWRRISKPTPEQFFADLRPHPADGFLRQAMVLTWMMMPREGGREVKDAVRIVTDIFERNLVAWDDDNATFTGRKKKKPNPAAKAREPKRGLKQGLKREPKPAIKKGRTMEKDTPRNAKASKTPAAAPKTAGRTAGAARAQDGEVANLRAEMDQKIAQAGAGKSKVSKK